MKSIDKYIKLRAIFFKTLFMVFTMIFFITCEVLDITPVDSFTETVVYNDPDLATANVNYIYRVIPFGFKYCGWTTPLSWMCDECNARLSDAATGPIVRGDFNPSYLGAMNVWTDELNCGRSYWSPIKLCNEFLAKTVESDVNPDLLSRLRAEARTIRAYSYFRLISYFGGVPLITEPFSLHDDWRIPRNSYDDCMDFVISELDEVIDILPINYNDAELGRTTKGSAMAIKARALLYYASPLNNPLNDLSRWQLAADAAKAVIDLGIYDLYPDYKELFMEAGGYNEEIIWARRMNNTVDQEVRTEQLYYPNGEYGYGQIHPLQNVIDDFEMNNGKKINEPDSGYDPQNPYVNRDPRFYYMILYDGAPFRGREIETFLPGGFDTEDGPIYAWNMTETGYYPRKFIDESKTGLGFESNSDPLWPWFRYGEILLNYAEAMFKLGNEDVCREYINKIRSRPSVNMPPVTESGQDLWDRYINERRIEMYLEEARFFDVRRWLIAEDVLSRDRMKMYIYKDPNSGKKTYEVKFFRAANFNSWNYLAPIPQSEIDKNSLIEQNPGY